MKNLFVDTNVLLDMPTLKVIDNQETLFDERLNEWLINRGKDVLDFQKYTIKKAINSIYTNPAATVIGMAPGAGKTLVSHIIEEILVKDNKYRVLVLTHGTTVLRTQYAKDLLDSKPDFTWSVVVSTADYKRIKSSKDPFYTEIKKHIIFPNQIIDCESQVIVAIPHTIKKVELPNFEVLVIDEAHHFYFDKEAEEEDRDGASVMMVQKIRRKIQPAHQMLLTGSPFYFNGKPEKYNVIGVTLCELYEADRVTNLKIKVASSSFDFTTEDYNKKGDVKRTTVFNKLATKTTLRDLIKTIVKEVGCKPSWKSIFQEIGQTMWVCKRQATAKKLRDILTKEGIKTALSTSDSDKDCIEIDKFTADNSDVQVLIVVGRGILGFNYAKLVNVIDMTLSMNVTKIQQLMCRVIRKHPQGRKKLFLKITPNHNGLEDYFYFIMQFVLLLSSREYYFSYDGTNMPGMKVPTKVEEKDIDKDKPTGGSGGGNSGHKPKALDFSKFPIFDFLKHLEHKNNAVLGTFAMATMRDVKIELLSGNNYWTEEKILKTITG